MNDTLSPARLDQILETRNRHVVVDADTCSVVDDLRRIDKTLGVRFVDGPQPFFAVYQEIEHPDGKIEQHLVTTVQAHLNSFGTYSGLDNRIVERVRKITHESYDFMAKADEKKRKFEADQKNEREQLYGEYGEQAAHAIRKDLGVKTRAFIK